MSVPTTRLSLRLTTALHALDLALDAPRRPGVALGNWRWLVRQRVIAVRDSLSGQTAGAGGWLAAHGGPAFDERNVLLTRLAEQMSRVLETAEVEAVRVDLKRLVVEVRQHAEQAAARRD